MVTQRKMVVILLLLALIKEIQVPPNIPIHPEATKKETRKKMPASNVWKQDIEN